MLPDRRPVVEVVRRDRTDPPASRRDVRRLWRWLWVTIACAVLAAATGGYVLMRQLEQPALAERLMQVEEAGRLAIGDLASRSADLGKGSRRLERQVRRVTRVGRRALTRLEARIVRNDRELARRTKAATAIFGQLEGRIARLEQVARRADAISRQLVAVSDLTARVRALEQVARRADTISRRLARLSRLRGRVKTLEDLADKLVARFGTP